MGRLQPDHQWWAEISAPHVEGDGETVEVMPVEDHQRLLREVEMEREGWHGSAEQGPRWPSRKAAWADGYREGQQQARMTGSDRQALREQLEAEVRERLLSQEIIDTGDANLMARSEVEPNRFVPDFETGLRAALAAAFPPPPDQGERAQ